MAEGFFGVVGHLLDAVLVADVEFERDGAAAERLDFFFEVGEMFALAAGEDEIGAGFGESASEVLAETAAGAGDDGDFTSEVEKIFVRHS